MLKRLLYLYNDGHNPFPKLGKGGLGYHLPQYPKVIHGSGPKKGPLKLHDTDSEDEEEPEQLGTQPLKPEILQHGPKEEIEEMLKQASELTKIEDEKLMKKLNEELDELSKLKTQIKKEEPSIQTEAEIKEAERQAKIARAKKGKEEEAKMIAERQSKKQPIEQKITPISNEVQKLLKVEPIKVTENEEIMKKPMSTKTIAEVKKNIKADLKFENIKPTETELIYNSIIKKYPNITYEDYKKDPKKYKDEYYNEKHGKKESMEQIQKAVNEVHYKGETDTKGHAAEIVFLRDHQDTIKELVGSTDPDDIIMPSSDSDGFKDETGKVPIVGKKQKPLSHYSLFDADGKNSSIDLKYYDSKYADIQFTKICGSVNFIPLYHEVDGKLKLYNVSCLVTNKFINRHNNTNTFIISIDQTTGNVNSWEMTKFIQKNIRPDEYENHTNEVGEVIFKTPKKEFVNRMIKEKKLLKPRSHTKEYEKGDWFSVNMQTINKK
jgi:hypothetical protein